jgi:hypothetical protein
MQFSGPYVIVTQSSGELVKFSQNMKPLEMTKHINMTDWYINIEICLDQNTGSSHPIFAKTKQTAKS